MMKYAGIYFANRYNFVTGCVEWYFLSKTEINVFLKKMDIRGFGWRPSIIMLYGILLWGKSDNVQTIDKLQKRAIRLISYSRPLEHTEPLLKVFNLLKFNDIYALKLLKFFYKLSNNSLPPYFDSYKTLIQPLTDRYPLRRPLYQTFRVNHEFARISLKY